MLVFDQQTGLGRFFNARQNWETNYRTLVNPYHHS